MGEFFAIVFLSHAEAIFEVNDHTIYRTKPALEKRFIARFEVFVRATSAADQSVLDAEPGGVPQPQGFQDLAKAEPVRCRPCLRH